MLVIGVRTIRIVPAPEFVLEVEAVAVPSAWDEPEHVERDGAPQELERFVPVVEPGPAVAPDVVGAAFAVAREVWSQGGRPLELFYERSNRVFMDEYVAHAVVMGWVAVQGDVVVPGSVNPRPVSVIGDVDGPSWGSGRPGFSRVG